MSEKPETALIRNIRQYLELHGCIVTRVNAGLTFLGSEEENNRRVMRGADKGTSDLLVCRPDGRFIAIEVKVGKNRPTPAQQDFIEQVRSRGGIAFAAWSIDDVARELGWNDV